MFIEPHAIFRVKPFGAPPLRAVKKAQKHYHYDWIQVRDRAARFENLVAMHHRASLATFVHIEWSVDATFSETAVNRTVVRTRGDVDRIAAGAAPAQFFIAPARASTSGPTARSRAAPR